MTNWALQVHVAKDNSILGDVFRPKIQGLFKDFPGPYLEISRTFFKSVSMRKPGRTRREVIQLKSPISLKLGTTAGFREYMIMAKT